MRDASHALIDYTDAYVNSSSRRGVGLLLLDKGGFRPAKGARVGCKKLGPRILACFDHWEYYSSVLKLRAVSTFLFWHR